LNGSRVIIQMTAGSGWPWLVCLWLALASYAGLALADNSAGLASAGKVNPGGSCDCPLALAGSGWPCLWLALVNYVCFGFG
jgi:hypothetical protein